MMRTSSLILAAAGLSIAAAASASPAIKARDAAPAPAVVAPATKVPISPPSLEAMLAFVDKLFPPQPDPDPARLALARIGVQAMWPDGAYGRMMSQFMGGMFDRMMQLKASDLAALSGKPKGAAVAPATDLSLHQQVAGKDPYFDQRMAAMRDAINGEMSKVSAIVDPRMREGLARAMARRFDARQLGDINHFFAGSTGQAFAGQYMQLWLDPDTMRSIFSSMPELMKLMPELSAKLKAANDRFPKPTPAPPGAKSR